MKKIDFWSIGLILLIVFFLGFQSYYISNEAVTNDETLYAWYVHLLREDPSAIFSPELWQFHPPLVPLLASLFWFIDPLTSMRIVSILLGALSIFLIGIIGKKYAGPWEGLTAASLVGLNSFVVGYSHFGLLDTVLVAASCLIGLGWLTRDENPSRAKWLMAAGVFLAIFSKRSGFMVVGVWVIGMIVFRFLPKRRQSISTHLKLHWKEIIWCVCVSAFAWIFSGIFDRGIFSFYDYSAGYLSILLHTIPSLKYIVPGWAAILLFIGYFDIKTILEKERIFFIGWIGVFGMALFFPYFDPRYFFPALPAVGLLATLGASRVCQFFSLPKWLSFVGIVFLLAPGLIALGNNFSYTAIEIGYADAGAWLATHARGAVVYDPLEREIRYFSGFELEQWGGTIIKFPNTPSEFLHSLAQHPKPIFAVVANWPNFYGPFYPTDSFLLDQNFTLAYSVERMVGGKPVSVIRIYHYS